MYPADHYPIQSRRHFVMDLGAALVRWPGSMLAEMAGPLPIR